MKKRFKNLSLGLTLSLPGLFLIIFGAGLTADDLKIDQIKKMWESQYRNSVLDIKYMGGKRSTNQLHNQHYITPIGTCWDYDIVELQKCGCKSFSKASICCKNGSLSDCEIRIGDSKPVDCTKYGKPKYGSSGNIEPSECKKSRNQSDCWAKRRTLSFGPGFVIGSCKGVPYFICPKGQASVDDFYKNKCGPTPEDCGCKINEDCSDQQQLKCYKEWKKGIK